ncbi:MAG: DUF1289 domain-containing protein [Rhodospirillales bacterium]
MAKRATVISPCIGVCILDPRSGQCAGCFRTAAEIQAWPGDDDERRLEVLEELKARRRAAGLTSPADSRPRRRQRRQTTGKQ